MSIFDSTRGTGLTAGLLVLAVLLFALFLDLLGWFLLVGLFTTFVNTRSFEGDWRSPLSDLLIAHHSPYLLLSQELESSGWCRHIEAQHWDLSRVSVFSLESEAWHCRCTSRPTPCSGSRPEPFSWSHVAMTTHSLSGDRWTAYFHYCAIMKIRYLPSVFIHPCLQHIVLVYIW